MSPEAARAIAHADPATFKAAFIAWYAESEHAGWDGFDPRSVIVLDDFLADFALYVDNTGPDDHSGFIRFGDANINLETGTPQI
jgi:hypothetical protein